MGQLVRAVAASRKSSELFKTLSKVKVVLNPFDHRSTTAREFVRRVRAPPVRKANAGLAVEVEVTEKYGGARIALEYADGFRQEMRPETMRIRDILEEVERVARWRGGKGEGGNPFEEVRARRARALGLAE